MNNKKVILVQRSDEGVLMNICVLRPTPVCVERTHVQVPDQDIQDKVEAVSLAFAIFMLPLLITFFYESTKSTNNSPHQLLILQPFTCKYNFKICSKMYFFINFQKNVYICRR